MNRWIGCFLGLVFAAIVSNARGSTLVLDIGSGSSSQPLQALSPRTMGWSFDVHQSIEIDGLGFWDEGSNGLAEASHLVRLWNSDGSSLLASATVDNNSTPITSASTDGRWLFETIANLTLNPGTYVVGADYAGLGASGDRFRGTVDPLTTIPEVTYGGDLLGIPPGFPTTGGNFFNSYFGPNLHLADTGDVPEPASMVLWGLGGIGLFVTARRRRRRAIA